MKPFSISLIVSLLET